MPNHKKTSRIAGLKANKMATIKEMTFVEYK
jgi:hypothetical protein